MNLPYEFEYDGNRIREYEVQELSAMGIAEAQKMTKKGAYQGMRKMAEYVCLSLNGNEDRTFISNAIQSMPFYSLYTMLCYGLAATHGQDYVEGAYTCPKCRTVRYYDKTEDNDDSDKLEDVAHKSAEGLGIEFEFSSPIRIMSKSTAKGESTEEEISSITMRWPTIMDYVKGESAFPDDSTRCMFKAYSECITHLDGAPVDDRIRRTYGEMLFAKLSIKTLNQLSSRLSDRNIGHDIERVCLSCHHRWKTNLDLSLFFDFDR